VKVAVRSVKAGLKSKNIQFILKGTVSPEKKNGFIVFPRHKIILQKSGLIGNFRTCGEARLRYHIDLPPPHMVDHLICGEEQFLSTQPAVTRPCDTIVLTVSSTSSSSATSSPFFILP
jgi:hypothetical protein